MISLAIIIWSISTFWQRKNYFIHWHHQL